MTSADKAIGLRNAFPATLSLVGYAVEIRRNTGQTSSIDLSEAGSAPASGCVILYQPNGGHLYLSTLASFSNRSLLVATDKIRYMTGDDQIALMHLGAAVDTVGLSTGIDWGKNLIAFRSGYSGAATPATSRNGGGPDWTRVTSNQGTQDDWSGLGDWASIEHFLCPPS